MVIYLFTLCILLLRNVTCRLCGSDVTLKSFHFYYANGVYHYNANTNQYKGVTTPILYIWQPHGNAWIIGPDPDVLETGGMLGHFGWCGKKDLRNCNVGDWWYWNTGWFNDPDATILHSKPFISGMTFRPQFNGYWDFHDSYVDVSGGGYHEVYSKIETGPDQKWFLFPIVDGWSIGFALPTQPVSYETVMRCPTPNLLRCWEGAWYYVPNGEQELQAKLKCSDKV